TLLWICWLNGVPTSNLTGRRIRYQAARFLLHTTLHHGTANTSGASHSSVLPECNRSPLRAFLPYSARKVRRCAQSASRGRAVAFTSIGRGLPFASITKSTSSPIVVRQ